MGSFKLGEKQRLAFLPVKKDELSDDIGKQLFRVVISQVICIQF